MEKKKLKILFMGTPIFAEAILAALIGDGYNIAGVFTQPDKKSGRKQELQKSPVKMLAEKKNIPIFSPEKLDAKVTEEIKTLNPDLIVVAAYGKIIPKSILEIPGFQALNVHPSLLPKFRGASPIQNAILAGEKETGTTIMLMDEGMDTGAVLGQRKIKIDESENSEKLSAKLASESAKLLIETIPFWADGKIIPRKQDSNEATLCKIIKREDGEIDWNDSAQNIHNKYRAFSPWPGVFSFWKRNEKSCRIKLNRIGLHKITDSQNLPAGKITKTEGGIAVKAAAGLIILKEVQLEGKKNMYVDEFVNGYPDFVGAILK